MMAGMLVLVDELEARYADEAYEPVDKAAVAVNSLFGVDPDFVEFCKTLYGDVVDPVAVYCDVYKANPTGPDMMTPAKPSRGRRIAAGTALVGTGAGAALAAGKLRSEMKVPGVRGKLVPAAALGADVIATEELGHNAKTAFGFGSKKQRASKRDQAIAKLSVPGVHQMAEGIEAGIRGKLIPKVTQPFKEAKLGATGAQMRRGGRFAQQSGAYRAGSTLAGSPARRLATGGALAAAGTVGGVAAGRNKVDKRDDIDVTWAGQFSKFDEDKRLVFGWASVVEMNGMPIVDRQGDYIHPDDLENASYEYVIKSRVGGDMHRRSADDIPVKVSDLVESMVFTHEKVEKMGLPPEVAKNIPTGWWVGFKVHDDEAWDLVKKRGRGGFSIHGRGKRVEKNLDELVPGYH